MDKTKKPTSKIKTKTGSNTEPVKKIKEKSESTVPKVKQIVLNNVNDKNVLTIEEKLKALSEQDMYNFNNTLAKEIIQNINNRVDKSEETLKYLISSFKRYILEQREIDSDNFKKELERLESTTKRQVYSLFAFSCVKLTLILIVFKMVLHIHSNI